MKYVLLLSQLLDPDTVNVPKGDFTQSNLKIALQLVTGIAAAVAMLIIVLAGLKYGLSRGNSDEITKAKDTIIYAVAGLILSIAAFSIVTFVVGRL